MQFKTIVLQNALPFASYWIFR